MDDALADGKIHIVATAPLGGKVEDLKVSGKSAWTVDRDGHVSEVAGIW